MDELFSVLGSFELTSLPSEELSRKNARRSLVALRKITKGEKVTKEHLTWKRPATGISPNKMNELLGKKALVDVDEDEVLHWHMFE
jgi:N-acetylneuraminate synthase